MNTSESSVGAALIDAAKMTVYCEGEIVVPGPLVGLGNLVGEQEVLIT
jgi:hypothetical protein